MERADPRKLYHVKIRIDTTDPEPGMYMLDAYVVAESSEHAYHRARDHLDRKSKGGSAGRDMAEYSIEELAAVLPPPLGAELIP